MEETLENRAKELAIRAHGNQKRKYTGEPYTVHLTEVVEIIKTIPHTKEMVAAAWLHDTLEDTDLTLKELADECGIIVAGMVNALTDCSKSNGNRKRRKEIDRQRLSVSLPEVQSIKLADIISNASSIEEHDPDFAVVWLREKALMLEVLTKGDKTLMERARKEVGK
jgi:(p)ppGpp synthase/HD superfamily hydrolase